MRFRMFKILALLLLCCIVLTGCGLVSGFLGSSLVPYSQMEYVRPDMVAFSAELEKSCTAALEEQNINTLERAILDFYQVYDSFYTNLNLAMISYSCDLMDIYWQEEYSYCISHSAEADAGLDRLYRSLAKSPLRQTLEGEDYFGEGYFDSFEGESIYDDYLTQLLSQEALLCSEYQSLNGQAAAAEYYSEEYFTLYGAQMAQMFLELVQLRQQIAAYVGYESYPEFAYAFYHIRDYTPQQATAYVADIRAELVPLYRQLTAYDHSGQQVSASTEAETFNYVKTMAKNMGGVFSAAFADLEKAGVYDISYGERKYDISFETYLAAYQTPFIFLSPTGTAYDRLTFAHEFGHFCADYVMPGGSVHSVDVAEIFSQGMEYVSLLYSENTAELQRLKMLSCLEIYVEQAAFASFEHQVYELSGEQLSVEGIQKLYEEVCVAFGLDMPGWDSRDYVCVPHFYESPLYIISYVCSNDVALQIYEMEQQGTGTGLSALENGLYSRQPYLLAFLEEAGLESPFEAGRLTRVRQLLEETLT